MGFGQARFDTITHENFGDLSQKFVKGKRTSALPFPCCAGPTWAVPLRSRCGRSLPGQIRTTLEGFAWHLHR
jgi:hypothetical protein